LIAVVIWITPTKTQQRLQTFSDHDDTSQWKETLVNIVGPFAKLSAPTGDWDTSPLRVKFINAGIRSEDARYIFYGAKTLLPILFTGITYFSLMGRGGIDESEFWLWVSLAALIGCYVPNFALHRLAKNRRREIFENFPDAADLMLVCVEAGLGLDAGLTRVADEIKMKSMAIAEELHLTNLEMRAGATREKSLRNLALRTGIEEISTFATMLTQADKFGTSIGESLRVFSDDLRHKRQVRAEETAAKIPTKMLLPLVICIFPSVLMVILGPAIIQIVRTVVPMLGGAS
jgi:tight adherence protein C